MPEWRLLEPLPWRLLRPCLARPGGEGQLWEGSCRGEARAGPGAGGGRARLRLLLRAFRTSRGGSRELSSPSEEESDSREEQEEEEEPSLEPESESEAEQPSDSEPEVESSAGSSLGRVRSSPVGAGWGTTASSQSGAMVVRGALVAATASADNLIASTSRVEVKEEAPQSKLELARPGRVAERPR
jgi:hypothetical protein